MDSDGNAPLAEPCSIIDAWGQARTGLSMQEKLRWILDLTRKLAAPVELESLLLQVVESAKELLDAEGATVWLYDAESDELVMQVSTGLDPIRIPADHGIVGASL